MGEAAYHGIVGNVVEAILPYSESDPAALVANFLVLAGNRIGLAPVRLRARRRSPLQRLHVRGRRFR